MSSGSRFIAGTMNHYNELLKRRVLVVLSTLFVSGFLSGRAFTDEPPPGIVIAKSPEFSNIFTTSPSLARQEDGVLFLSYGWAGPKIDFRKTLLCRSNDGGNTWTQVSEILGRFWCNLFIHRGALYLLGPMQSKSIDPSSKNGGAWVIQRSLDGGKTWTQALDSRSGILLEDGCYHTAPCPVVFHHGRLWRALEYLREPKTWGTCFQAMMSSVPEDADLLDAANWVFSEKISYPFESWPGRGWLEGNAVVDPEGNVVNVLRVARSFEDKAAILTCSRDGRRLFCDPETSLIDFPGGAVKFTIRYDEKSKKYWTLSTKQKFPKAARNFLVLAASDDLRHWEVRTVVLRHRDMEHYAFNYCDWLFDGDDIVFASRTAWHGAPNRHDANYITFHRLKNFRNLSRDEDSPWLGDPESSLGPQTR